MPELFPEELAAAAQQRKEGKGAVVGCAGCYPTATTLAAAPAVRVKDTIKVSTGGAVDETPDRSTLYAVQTPQVFDRDLLAAALQNAKEQGIALTDDCSAVEALGMPVQLTDGDEENLKITTPLDLELAALILRRRANA